MLFNSFGFIFLFLPTVFGVWYVLQKFGIKAANIFLVLVSLGFYATLDAKHLPLLLFSVIVNFLLGMRLQRAVDGCAGERKSGLPRFARNDGVGWDDAKVLLILAVVFNLALLGASKYIADFTVLSALGISFFTFHQLAYHVDIYRGGFRANGFLEYLLFVAFFPHMIAGPIVRPAQFMPQLTDNGFTKSKIAMGVMFFSIGLFKKTVFADGAAKIADRVFDGGVEAQFFEAWSGVLAYGMQIYFDFSGYADMAIGVGLLFGIYLPLNFKNPYKATSMIEFWRRWHITLSDFVRDYLYIPLGGNRHGKFRQGAAILVAMTLIGVWHGSAWSFVAWGFLHGVALWVNHLFRGVFWERKREVGVQKSGLPRLSLRGFSRGNLNDGREARNDGVGRDDGEEQERDCRATLAMTRGVAMTEKVVMTEGDTMTGEQIAMLQAPRNDRKVAMAEWIVKAGGFIMTFTTVTLLWVLFRSDGFEAAMGFYKKLFLFDKNIALFEGWWMLAIGYAVIFFGRSAAEIVGYGMEREKKLGIKDGVLAGVVLFLAFKMMMGEPSRSFVYFVF